MQSQDKVWLNPDSLKPAEVNCSRGGFTGGPEIILLAGLNFRKTARTFPADWSELAPQAARASRQGRPELSLPAGPGVTAGWYELSRRQASVSRHACLNLPAELPVLHCKAVRTFAKTCPGLP